MLPRIPNAQGICLALEHMHPPDTPSRTDRPSPVTVLLPNVKPLVFGRMCAPSIHHHPLAHCLVLQRTRVRSMRPSPPPSVHPALHAVWAAVGTPHLSPFFPLYMKVLKTVPAPLKSATNVIDKTSLFWLGRRVHVSVGWLCCRSEGPHPCAKRSVSGICRPVLCDQLSVTAAVSVTQLLASYGASHGSSSRLHTCRFANIRYL